MSNPDMQNPQIPQTPWQFSMDADGVPSLYAVAANGALLLVYSFLAPEVFKQFVGDTNKAYEKFLPKAVRDALSILDMYSNRDNKQEPGNNSGSGGVPAVVG